MRMKEERRPGRQVSVENGQGKGQQNDFQIITRLLLILLSIQFSFLHGRE
jgi:hypothetical protein